MRIRKRKVPLPLSLLSPIPLTDLHLFSRSPVESDHNFYDHVTIPTCCSSDLRPLTTVSLATTGVEGVQISNDDSSNASITTSAPQDDDINNLHNNGPLLLSNNEGVIPLKKRRTMIAKRSGVGNDEEEFEEEKKMMMMKSSNNNNNGENSKKNNGGKRGSTIMEGSRCSRVNGRGWRCCQQTLVGYSLCEHHLGKGRLRSMTGNSSSNKTAAAAKLRSSKKKKANNNNNNNSNNDDNNNNNDSNSNTVCSFNTTGAGFMLGSHYGQQIKEETCANNSKRVKLGVVKARSLSSLLCQTNGLNNNIVGDHANMHPQQEKMSN